MNLVELQKLLRVKVSVFFFVGGRK